MYITSAPHIKRDDSVAKIMWSVNLALVPALAASVYFFGLRALMVTAVAVISCIIFEHLSSLLMKRKSTISDGSACVTGILLAFNLPVTIPFGMVAIGSFVAIAIVKMAFGGLGCNVFNPALVGRAFLLASYPVAMTNWVIPHSVDAITSPTPLAIVKHGFSNALPSYWDMFIGNRGGCLGETSIIMLLIGGAFLLYRKVITWHVPVTFIGSVALIYWIFGGTHSFSGDPLFGVMSGGVVLGALFMATDMVTGPLTTKGKLLFGCGIGIITCLIRFKGNYPEGVSYAILMMNLLVPIIDRYIKR